MIKRRKDLLDIGLSYPSTYQDRPFKDTNWVLIRIKGSKKAFLWTYELDGELYMNIKVDLESRDSLRNSYEDIKPAYHQNKEHWSSVRIGGDVDDEPIKVLIDVSYTLVSGRDKQK